MYAHQITTGTPGYSDLSYDPEDPLFKVYFITELTVDYYTVHTHIVLYSNCTIILCLTALQWHTTVTIVWQEIPTWDLPFLEGGYYVATTAFFNLAIL